MNNSHSDSDSNSDSESDSDKRNEIPLQPISPEFIEHITQIKNKLYNKIVFDTYSEDDSRAQNPDLLNVYLNLINKLHTIFQIDNITKLPQTHQQPWKQFPEDIREDIIQLINIYLSFLQNNNSQSQRAPYEHFIELSFHEDPYRQIPSEGFGYNPDFLNEFSD